MNNVQWKNNKFPISTRSKSNHTKNNKINEKKNTNLEIAIDILIYFTDTPHSTFFQFNVPDVVF